MTINATMGVKSIKYGNVGSTPATAIADVYQDSATFVTKDATVTEHKSETSSKRIVMTTKEGHELKFSIMDPTPAEIAAFMGGTANGTSGWTEAEESVQIDKALEVEPVQGLKLHIPSASITAKFNTTFSAKGITLLDVTATTTAAITFGTAAQAGQ